MQKTKTITIGDKTFTLRELPVRKIWELVNGDKKETDNITQYQGLLAMACPDLTSEAMLDMYPSEIEELWQTFEEVNASFLGMTRRIGLDQALLDAVKAAVTGSIRQSASLSSTDTAQ